MRIILQVYSQSVAGGLPTNTIQPTASELKFTTYTLDSAVAFDRKYASRSRLDVIGKTFTRCRPRDSVETGEDFL